MSNELRRSAKKQRLLQFYRNGNNKETVAPSQPVAQVPRENDVLSIDSPTFNSTMYLEHRLREKDLSDLMQEERVMTDQIRSLDSEMQTLMYDNYSKFISATDTIRMMKSDFRFLENEMSSLIENMSSIALLSNGIKDNLQDGRSKLKTLLATQQTLERLKHLTDLPMRLRKYVDDCNWETAINELDSAKLILKTYQNTPSFREIRGDCFDIVSEITNNIRKGLDRSTDANEVSRNVRYLRMLGFGTSSLSKLFLESARKHLTGLLMGMQVEHKHTDVNAETEEGLSLSTKEYTQKAVTTAPLMLDILHFANLSTDSILTELTTYVVTYSSLFLIPNDELNETMETILSVVSDRREYDRRETDVLQLEASLTDLVCNLMDKFFQLVEDRFDAEVNCEDSAILVRALDRVHSHTLTFIRSLNTCIEGAHPLATADIWELDQVLSLEPASNSLDTSPQQPRRLGDNILTACRQCSRAAYNLVCRVAHARIDYHVNLMRKSAIDCVTNVRQQLIIPMTGYSTDPAHVSGNQGTPGTSLGGSANISNLSDLSDDLNSSLLNMIRDNMNAQWIFLNHENTFVNRMDFREHFCMTEVHERLLSVFLDFVLDFLEDMATTASNRPSGSLLLLLLAKFCLTWADSGTIGHLLSLPEEQLKSHLVPSSNYILAMSTGGGFITSNLLTTKAATTTTSKRFTDRYRCVAINLLSAFARLEGTNSAQLLRKSVEARDWLKNLEPRSVRSVMKRVIEDMNILDRQISQLFASTGQNKDRLSDSRSVRSLRQSIVSSSSASSHLERGVGVGIGSVGGGSEMDPALAAQLRRLFTQKIDIFAPVESNRESLLWGIIKIGLKTLVECVRLQTFGRYGLQQIQVDCRYFQVHLWHFVNDDKLINGLLDDVVYSAFQRCVDPQLMEDSIVETICDRA